MSAYRLTKFGRPFIQVLTLFLITAMFSGLQAPMKAAAAPQERPHADTPPSVSLSVPAESFLGQDFIFTVQFDNTDTVPGYGPLIDLILPTNGADGAQNTNPPLDGLTFVSATYLGMNVESTVLTFPGSGRVTCVDHPYMVDNTGNPVQVCGDAGDTFVAMRLPFGSFTPDQPVVDMDVAVSMSNLADLDTPLTIQARGGYQFGYTPSNDYSSDDPSQTLSGLVNDSVTPILFTLEKSYSGPEDETASGSDFPRQYTVTAEIAPGQTMTSFSLTDVLPDNMQFLSVISTIPAGAPCTHSNAAVPDGTLTCNFDSASGTVTMTFEYYIPLRDASDVSVIDPSTGDDAPSCNNASGGGTWTPIDPRDAGGTFTNDPAGCEHTLTDKAIATQKSVAVVGGGQPAPGEVLEYTIDFQISDFFAFDQIVATDTFSDGQRLDSTFVPTLEINGNTYTLAAAAMNADNVNVACNYTGAIASPPAPPDACDSLDPAANDGTTTIAFDVSDEIMTRGQYGRLIGGCVPTGGTGGGDPDCGSYDDGPTTGRIVFRTVIQDQFSDDYPSGDRSVDQGDVLDDTETINGHVLSTTDASTPTGSTEDDDSSASVSIGHGSLTKEIYAVNGSTTFSTPVVVRPGDTLTYRLTYTLPTGDVEDLHFDDYLPLPVFHVDDPDANGTAGPVWSFVSTVNGTAPASGVAKFGPSDTFYNYSNITPTLNAISANNRLDFLYGDFDELDEQPYTVDLLFTVTVSNDPFADGLYLTNQVQSEEGSTNSIASTDTAIIQFILAEPAVANISKGAVWTDNPNGIFTPATVGPVTFDGSAAACAGRLGGLIHSSGLDTNPVNSNLRKVDAADTVMMAIVVENTGHSSAFDVKVRDALPSGMTYVANSLCVTDGTGDAFSYTGGGSDGSGLFDGDGVELTDPGPTVSPPGALDPGVDGNNNIDDGRNIAVITYLVTLDASVQGGQVLSNTATLFNYSNVEGGQDFTAEDPTDTAETRIRSDALGKTFTTEIINSFNTQTQVVIGESIDYTLTLTFHEGMTPNVTLEENLPAGLAFVDCLSIAPSSVNLTTDLTGGFSAACNDPTNPNVSSPGQNFTFTLGTITNANTDNSVNETLDIVFRAVTLNVSGNQADSELVNKAILRIDGGSGGTSTVQSAPATVIEPQINTSKSVSPTSADAGDTVTFTVTLSNPAADSTTAYDAAWSDTIPTGLTYVPGSLALGDCTASTPLVLSDAGAPTLTGSGGLFQPGETCTISFNATVDYTAAPGQVITNTAETRWTSLSGVVNDRSTYNTDSDERTGADGVGGALNDYASQGLANLSIENTTPNKYLLATSEAHTGVVSGTERVAIGEIVRYRLVVQLPEGTSANFQIRDNLPSGLTYLDDGTAKAALVSNGTGITSSAYGSLPVPGITDTDCFLTGNAADGTTPAIPAVCDALADNNVGSSNSTSDDIDSYNNGTDPYFKLGTLTNNDSDADTEYVILEFNALINNTAAGDNDAGETRNNNFDVFIDGTQNGSPSNNLTVRIAEPSLSLTKAVATAPSDAGDPISYTLTITAASGDDLATAFDLNLTDTFDSNLTDLSVTNVTATQGGTCVGNGGGSTAFSHNGGSFTGNALTFTATCLDPGQSITITVTGTVATTTPTGYTIPNTANMTWTSLPGIGTESNPTGSTTPGGSGADNGERDGSNGVGVEPDDYAATSTVNAPLAAAPQVDKRDPSPTSYAIGEQITFDILVTLPEGVAQALQVVDDLPVGLQYVSHQVITIAAVSGGLLAADYNGSFINDPPTFSCAGTCASGDDITLDFGDTTTTADNVTNNDVFLIRVVAQVLNESGNQQSPPPLVNSATMTVSGTDYTDTVSVDIVEPILTITKTASDIYPGPNQVLTFTLTVQHDAASNSGAYDVLIYDDLPAELTLNPASVTVTLGGAAAGATNNSSGNRLEVLVASIPNDGSTVTIQFQASVSDSVEINQVITNTANVTWTSTPGANDNERTGSGTGPNDYAASGSVTLNIQKSLSKSIVGDNHGATTLPEVAIGEIVTYKVDFNVPVGLTTGVTITDVLDLGLAYMDCVTIVASDGITTTTPGGFASVCSSPAVSRVGDPLDPSNAGRQVIFNFGDLENTSGAVGLITIQYRVVVLDIIENQETVNLNNSVTLNWSDGPLETVSTTPVVIVEPDLLLDKTADVSIAVPNTIITFTLTVEHSTLSSADAFDVLLEDIVPAGLKYVPGSLTYVSGSAPTTIDDTAAPTLQVIWEDFPRLPGNAVIQFQARLQNIPPGSSVSNVAYVEWSSLPGNIRLPQSDNNDYSTERYYNPLSPIDNYGVTANFNITVPALPNTGFAPSRITEIPVQAAEQAYSDLGSLWLEIPRLGVKMPIVGIPAKGSEWDLTWLWEQAGWLTGTAYPTTNGNSVVTGHVYLPNGQPGPFVGLSRLKWGDRVVLHVNGLAYAYEIRNVEQVTPDNLSAYRHEDVSWVTLVTCQGYNPSTNTYDYRLVVQAVLMNIEADASDPSNSH